MKLDRRVLAIFIALATLALGAGGALLGICGPFTDVTDAGFCPFVLEIFTLGITTGTSPTTYDPTSSVSRLQMAAFLSRTVDGALKRGGRRAALDQYWTPQNPGGLGVTTLSGSARQVRSDGTDLWVSIGSGDTVFRVQGSDGRVLETWTGATFPSGIVAAAGRILVAGATTPGRLYAIDPSQPAGVVTTVASTLGAGPVSLTFDGARFWTTNNTGGVSIVTPGASIPWSATTVTAGFSAVVNGALFDGASIWAADFLAGTLLKLDPNAAVLQTVTVGTNPNFPIFDGTNAWVPNNGSSSVTVVRVATGAVLATLTGNGLLNPLFAAFDGQRVLVTNQSANNVSLWKAADLSPLGTLPTEASARGAASDGVSFWVTLPSVSKLVRF